MNCGGRELLAFEFADFASVFRLSVALLENGALSVCKTIGRNNIAKCAVQANLIVTTDEGFCDALCVLES